MTRTAASFEKSCRCGGHSRDTRGVINLSTSNRERRCFPDLEQLTERSRKPKRRVNGQHDSVTVENIIRRIGPRMSHEMMQGPVACTQILERGLGGSEPLYAGRTSRSDGDTLFTSNPAADILAHAQHWLHGSEK
jgi:hypothetical protein